MEKFCGKHYSPILDCVWNQYGTCNKRVRKSKVDLMRIGEDKPSYENAPTGYVPCTFCKEFFPKDFTGTTWYKEIDIEKLSSNDVIVAGNRFFYIAAGKEFKLKSYPNKSINFKDLKNQLDMWEHYDNFIPDIIILDYIDNMAPENGRMEFRHQINETWQAARALSQERNILLITATQADRKSYKKENIGMENASEDKRKNAHVTALFGLNQLPEDKDMGIMRVSQILAREAESDERNQVAVIQDYRIGRAYLNSYFPMSKDEINKRLYKREE
jgi:ribosomal protein S26